MLKFKDSSSQTKAFSKVSKNTPKNQPTHSLPHLSCLNRNSSQKNQLLLIFPSTPERTQKTIQKATLNAIASNHKFLNFFKWRMKEREPIPQITRKSQKRSIGEKEYMPENHEKKHKNNYPSKSCSSRKPPLNRCTKDRIFTNKENKEDETEERVECSRWRKRINSNFLKGKAQKRLMMKRKKHTRERKKVDKEMS